jgi:integrase
MYQENSFSSLTLAAYIQEKYVAFYLRKRLKNSYEDMLLINVIMSYEIGNKPLASITKNDLITFLAELQETRRIKKSTVNRYTSRLSNVFSFAVEEGDLLLSPLKGLKKHKEYYRDRCLEEDEIEALLKECRASRNKELYDITVLAINTGMRKSEITSLTSSNVNLARKKLILDWTKTKTGESRTIPLNDEALAILSKRIEQFSEGARLFKSRDFSGAFENAMKRAKIVMARFHDLRRTFATYLMDSGVPIGVISRILGHTNILTTERYLSFREKHLLESVSKIGFK